MHKLLLVGTLADPAAADRWKASCRDVFAWSEYFDGARRLPMDKPVPMADESMANGSAPPADGISSLQLSEVSKH